MMKNKKLKVLLIIVLIILGILGAAAGSLYYYYNSRISKIKHVELPEKREELSIPETITESVDDNYVNILLLGIDSRVENSDAARSDSIMILTIDKKHKKVKVTSVLRDSIMTMEGHGPMEGKSQDRLNHAYAYGGALLSIKTINENFQLNIKNYIKVDFFGLEKIIDALGGVPVNIRAEEISVANSYIKEVAKINKVTPDFIKKSGLQNMSGAQAVGYCRIRYVGNGDMERTERQRTVLDEVFKKLTQTNLTAMPGIADTMLPYIETSFSKSDLFDLGTFIVTNRVTTFEQSRLPVDGAWTWTPVVGNTYFAVWDKETNINALHKFIFEEDANK